MMQRFWKYPTTYPTDSLLRHEKYNFYIFWLYRPFISFEGTQKREGLCRIKGWPSTCWQGLGVLHSKMTGVVPDSLPHLLNLRNWQRLRAHLSNVRIRPFRHNSSRQPTLFFHLRYLTLYKIRTVLQSHPRSPAPPSSFQGASLAAGSARFASAEDTSGFRGHRMQWETYRTRSQIRICLIAASSVID